ncbi:DUF1353 domain-containing protein [Ilumatobacter sp.]|uniref:DUF1353 domain-containing protein n=1 Tax=Ilumatobacter sp. TaxID=1967498 RepID=UPI003B528032
MTVISPIEPAISVRGHGGDPWRGFSIRPCDDDRPAIRLEQIDRCTFRLASTVRYHGPTGLEGLDPESDRRIRTVDATTLRSTDLASIPGPLRWWINSYGVHTPAALIHDRFIGEPFGDDPGRPEGVSEQAIDRYFRFMLRELGVPFFRRWLMWAAVAFRTRMHAGPLRRIAMVLWIAIAIVGVGLLATGALVGDRGLVLAAAALPIPAAALWGRQAAAALIIAFVGVPSLLAPTAMAIPFLAIYALVEGIGRWCSTLLRRAERAHVAR